MASRDPRIDAYIIKSADFALPILEHLRALVHAACPEVEETMKWSFPHFLYKTEILCSMASFKKHCVFGLWQAAHMKDATVLLENSKKAMGVMGRITAIRDLPSNTKMLALIKEAMKLTGANRTKTKEAVPKLELPAFFSTALAHDKTLMAAFKNLSYSHQKEYARWLTDAKTIPTREKRLALAMQWIAAGKSRHWKYVK